MVSEFYTQLTVNYKVKLKDMVVLVCTLNEKAEGLLQAARALFGKPHSADRIVLVRCGGKQSSLKCFYDLMLTVYGIYCPCSSGTRPM